MLFHAYVQDLWKKTATDNTTIFETVFGGKIDPTNQATDLDRLKQWRVNYDLIILFMNANIVSIIFKE